MCGWAGRCAALLPQRAAPGPAPSRDVSSRAAAAASLCGIASEELRPAAAGVSGISATKLRRTPG
jgi:hypothetical protein